MTLARAASLSAILALLIGVMGLLGRWLDIPVLGAILPGQPVMRPTSALLVILTGLGLLLTPAVAPTRPALPAIALGIAVAQGSLLFLLAPSGDHSPSTLTSLVLLALGIALLCLQMRKTPVLLLGALSVFAVALPLYHLVERSLRLVGHDDIPTGPFATLSLNSTLALCLLAGPALFMHPRLPFGRQLFAASAHGRLMRLIMPWGTLAPVLLAVAIHYTSSLSLQYVEFRIVVALGLLSALATALLWRGHEKLLASESALRSSEARLNAMLQTLPDLVWLKDPDGVFLVCNPPVARLLGARVEQIVGRTDYDFHPPEIADAFVAGDRATLAADGPFIREGTVTYADDGHQADLETIKTPVRDSDGRLIGVLGIARDITARRQMERDLREREDLTRSVMNSLSSSIAVLDQNGNIVRVNDAWQRFAAANGGSALLQGGIGLNYLEACRRAADNNDPLAARVLDGLEGLLAGELPHFGTEYPCHGPSTQRWFMMQARTLVGAMPGLVVTHLDITLRKLAEIDLAAHRNELERLVAQRTHELENARAQAELILESTADGIFGMDMQGRIVFANPAAGAILGYPDDTLVGVRAHPTIHHSHADGRPYPPEDCPMLEALHGGRPIHVDDEVFWRADGTPLPVAYATQPMLTGNRAVGAVVSFHDMATRHAADVAREAALAEAQRLARVKSEFLANMSHEIRTPLNAVLGLARIGLRENIGRKTGNTYHMIMQAGEHLLGVINDILDFSKIDAGKLKIETRPFRLTTVIDNALGFVSEPARNKRIELTRRPDPDLREWVAGDPLRVEQILANLLSNAVKFTPQGRVSLTVADAGDSHTIRFTVADTGIGMNAEQISRLFGAFEQADGSTTREYGGTGLGLAISRRLAQLMGGDIEVESTPGIGSRFTLSLPLPPSTPATEPALTQHAATQRLAGLRLLAADDIEVNRLILDDLLTQEGAQVVFAANGVEALARIAEHGAAAFDAVLMDVQMPVMDGYAATRELHTRAPFLPVIGLTAHALAEEREHCLAAGMVEHVTKPINPAALVAAILRHVPARAIAPALTDTPPTATPSTEASSTEVSSTEAPSTAPLIAEAEPPPAARLIDWSALQDRFNHKDEFLRKLAASVQTTHRESAAKLAAAAAQQNFTALAFVAHSLKGTGGNLFAHALFDLAKATETAARANDPEAFALAGPLADLTAAFLAELAAWAAQP